MPFVSTVIARVMERDRTAGKCKHLGVEDVCSVTGCEGTQLLFLWVASYDHLRHNMPSRYVLTVTII